MSKVKTDKHIKLTNEQVKQLEPIYYKASEACESGKPGLVLAQAVGDDFRVKFIEHETAKKIQELFGIPAGQFGGSVPNNLK